MKRLILLEASLFIGIVTMAVSADIPRTVSGKPDLTGIYNIATLTPLERPSDTPQSVKIISEDEAEMKAAQVKNEKEASLNRISDPNREAPPVGGDGTPGRVGDRNSWWLDSGNTYGKVGGQYRTSIIYKPSNGHLPAMVPEPKQRAVNNVPKFDPYDGPESLSASTRCLLGLTTATPVLPSFFNNYVQIVQSEDRVMLLIEMVHDARVIRLNSEHLPGDIRKWTGDSIGWWEGDTLVVDTTNFTDIPNLYSAGRNLHVVEHFSLIDEKILLYNFTVEDPTVWVEPWSGEYEWKQTGEKLYEYACHESNYSVGLILRGARQLEREAIAKSHARVMVKVRFSIVVMTAFILALIFTLLVKTCNQNAKQPVE